MRADFRRTMIHLAVVGAAIVLGVLLVTVVRAEKVSAVDWTMARPCYLTLEFQSTVPGQPWPTATGERRWVTEFCKARSRTSRVGVVTRWWECRRTLRGADADRIWRWWEVTTEGRRIGPPGQERLWCAPLPGGDCPEDVLAEEGP